MNIQIDILERKRQSTKDFLRTVDRNGTDVEIGYEGRVIKGYARKASHTYSDNKYIIYQDEKNGAGDGDKKGFLYCRTVYDDGGLFDFIRRDNGGIYTCGLCCRPFARKDSEELCDDCKRITEQMSSNNLYS